MKILIVTNLYPPHYLGGYELQCKLVCEELIKRGYEIVVLTSDYKDENICDLNVSPYKVIRKLKLCIYFPKKVTRFLFSKQMETFTKNYRSTQLAIKKYNPDICYFWSQLRLTLGSYCAALDNDVPIFATICDDHLLGYKCHRFTCGLRVFRYIFDKYISPKNTIGRKMIANASFISRDLLNTYQNNNIEFEKTKIIYQSIEIDNFPYNPKQEMNYKEIKLLYVGQIHPYKGVHTILEAVNKIKSKNSYNLSVTIVGNGDDEYLEKLKKYSKENVLDVQFKGKIQNEYLCDIYQTHDIFIFPSIWREPFGMTFLEAMSSGLPVISTNEGGHGECVSENYNALIFEKSNSSDLSNKILTMISNEHLRKKLISNSRKSIESEFSKVRYVDEIEQFLIEE